VDVVSHPDMARLHPTGGHPESPRRLEVLLEKFDGAVAAEPAGVGDIERCHARGYIERIRAIDHVTMLDPDTICTPTSFDAALLAAGSAIEATRRGGFAFGRPPGHHALPDRAMGFCLFDNVAIAARWAQAELEVERVAIIDWDVHHGNGTEAIFAGDDSVLTVSVHQWPFYPGTGAPDDQAETTLNVPLPAGCGDADYARAFAEVVEPEVARFDPEFVLVAAGFDAHEDDPLAGMRVTVDGFSQLARRSAALGPRVAAILEGGYNLETLPTCVEAALEGFTHPGG
jgi:acetoin utilization deacetylase AcuC-like enzyme